MLSSTRDYDEHMRLSWEVGSFCLIYSRSNKTWYDGQINSIITDDEQKESNVCNEWLIVKYQNNKKTKRIQRMCGDIKPVPNDHNLTLQQGSACLIYSNVLDLWCKGLVIAVFHDSEGEWLKIKYWDTNEHKICDIQRYSAGLRTFSIRLLYQSIVNIPSPPKPWEELKSNNEILPLKLSNIVKLNENEFIVSGYSHDNEWSSRQDINGIYKYNIKDNRWEIFIPYPAHFFSQYHNMSVDYEKQIIYFIVGFGGIGMWKIDIKTKKFQSLALPREHLYGALSYIIDSQCNIFWGNGSNNHSVWTGKVGYIVHEFEEMKNGMISYGMVYNEKEKYFLLLGGFKGNELGRSDDIWRYRHDTGDEEKWEKLQIKLPDKMQSFGCLISLDCENVLILGGCDEDGLNDKIYILNLITMKWKISKIISPFRGIGYGNFIMIESDGIEYVHLLNGMYSSMQVPLSTVLTE